MAQVTVTAPNAPREILVFGIRVTLILPVVMALIAKTHQIGRGQNTEHQHQHQQEGEVAERKQARRQITGLPMKCVRRALWEIEIFGILVTKETNVKAKVVGILHITRVNNL